MRNPCDYCKHDGKCVFTANCKLRLDYIDWKGEQDYIAHISAARTQAIRRVHLGHAMRPGYAR